MTRLPTNPEPSTSTGKTRLRTASHALGFGTGPLLTMGVLAGGALCFTAFGVSQAFGDKDEPHATAESSPPTARGGDDKDNEDDKDNSVTVTLPDLDNNGIPDELETPGSKTTTRPQDEDESGGEDHTGTDDATDNGNDDNDRHIGKDDSQHADEPKREKSEGYVIKRGDTLSEISLRTGISVDHLADVNHIKDPNLIYAGSSLIIPPTP